MAVVQVMMEMSAEAALGIAAGTMVRHGGVIYNVTGGIVEHLVDATVSTVANEMPVGVAKASESFFSTVTKHLKNPKVLVAIGLGAVVVGGAIYYIKDKHKGKNNQGDELEIQKCIADYNDSLIAYLEAIDNGNVSLEIINGVIKCVGYLSENKEITVDFAQDKSETLINFVFNYTEKLAEANLYELIDFEELTSISAENTLSYLSYCLEIQKDIFEKAA